MKVIVNANEMSDVFMTSILFYFDYLYMFIDGMNEPTHYFWCMHTHPCRVLSHNIPLHMTQE